MVPRTHTRIDPTLCGHITSMEPGRATVVLTTTDVMAADAHGLVHGGFIFGAADYAAMVAVNEPNVVLVASEVRFTAPVRVGEVVHCTAEIGPRNGRKTLVEVRCTVGSKAVLSGQLTTAVLDQHVLTPRS
ncbi:MAG: hotdog domain-containing protein [Myxococcota bacterium]